MNRITPPAMRKAGSEMPKNSSSDTPVNQKKLMNTKAKAEM